MKTRTLIFTLTLVLSIIIIYFIHALYINKCLTNNALENQMIKYKTLTNKYNECKKEMDILNIEREKYNHEKYFTLKDLDIKLQNKIIYYIENNYQRVPKILVKDIAANIVKISRDENIPPELTLAIIQTESSFNPLSVSKQNARGLMQIMPMWAKEFSVKLYDLHDIKTNITIGIKVLKIHIKENKGDLSQGLYYYVNKDMSYVDKVYKNIGLFISSSEKIGESNGVNKKSK